MRSNAVIGLASDPHIGAQTGLCVEKWDKESGTYIANDAQIYTLKCWWDFRDYLKSQYKKLDYFIINGDSLAGTWQKLETLTRKTTEQIELAVELLKPMKAITKEFYVIRGTEAHDSIWGDAVESMARELKANRVPKYNTYSYNQLFINFEKRHVHISHSIGISQIAFYRANQITREQMLAALTADKIMDDNGVPQKVDVVVRGHVHYFNGSFSHRHLGFTLPCWQIQTPYAIQKSPFGFIPDIGGAVLEINDENARVFERLYPTPNYPYPIINAK